MKTILEATSEDELSTLSDFLHDRWFNLDGVDFDKESGIVLIPFEAPSAELALGATSAKGNQDTIYLWYLRIANAVDFSIKDTEKIGQYDFNRVLLEAGSSTINITSGVPLQMAVKVTSIRVELCSTNEILGKTNRSPASRFFLSGPLKDAEKTQR